MGSLRCRRTVIELSWVFIFNLDAWGYEEANEYAESSKPIAPDSIDVDYTVLFWFWVVSLPFGILLQKLLLLANSRCLTAGLTKADSLVFGVSYLLGLFTRTSLTSCRHSIFLRPSCRRKPCPRVPLPGVRCSGKEIANGRGSN